MARDNRNIYIYIIYIFTNFDIDMVDKNAKATTTVSECCPSNATSTKVARGTIFRAQKTPLSSHELYLPQSWFGRAVQQSPHFGLV